MVSSREAETMDYITYKRTFWSRMLAWWQQYLPTHPERRTFVQHRIEFCQGQVDHWNEAA
jgi:hypothetical protein